MRLFDTDVMIDILRGYRPALEWFASLTGEAPGLPGFVMLELMEGCRNRQEMLRLRKRLRSFQVYWPTDSDYDRAIDDFARLHLSHNLGVMDALIAATAIGLGATLYTFNTKHFGGITALLTEQPYPKG